MEATEKKSIYTFEGITDFMNKVNKEVYGASFEKVENKVIEK